MRNTNEKSIIRQAVVGRTDHPTAAMIHELAREQDPNISLGTVYRNLNTMAKRGEIRRIMMPDGADRFDPCLKQHSHFVCEKCGKVIDVDAAHARHSIRRQERKYKFVLTDVQLIGTGICSECIKNYKEELCQN